MATQFFFFAYLIKIMFNQLLLIVQYSAETISKNNSFQANIFICFYIRKTKQAVKAIGPTEPNFIS